MTEEFTFEALGVIGRSVSVPEKVAMTCSLKVLAQNEGRKVRFWGKVVGFSGSYLLCQTVPASLLDPVDTFFSVDGGTNWTKLDAATPEQVEFSEQLRGPFMGQPGYAYKLQKDIPPEAPDALPEIAAPTLPQGEDEEDGDAGADDGEGEEKEEGGNEGDAGADGEEGDGEEKKPAKLRPKFQILTMTEAARLSHFVAVHDAACKLTVRGAFLRNPDGTIVRNRTFTGLDAATSQHLQNYSRLALQENTAANRDLFGPNFNVHTDFLVPITEDRPVGIWTVKYDPSTGIVAVENLFFPGSLFAHRVDSAQTAQVYYGNGQRNLDLCFMLP